MRKIEVPVTTIFFLIIGVLFLHGCGTSPSPRFYTLTAEKAQFYSNDIAVDRMGVAIVTVIIELPDYLDRPEIVMRTKENQLILSELDLWAGSLKTDVSRVLLENLSSRFAGRDVVFVGPRSSVAGSHILHVLINRFEATTEENIELKAQWSFRGKNVVTPPIFKEVNVMKAMKGRSYNDVASAMSGALGELSAAIAGHLSSVTFQDNSK